MKKMLFPICAVLTVLGCSGDMDELPSCLGCVLCGKRTWDKLTEFCSEGTVYSKCDGNSYTPSTQKCCDNNKTYSIETEFCSGNLVYSKCGGMDYNPSTHFCSNGTVKAYSGTISYGGITYKTMVIGSETWFAENLNYNASGSKCYNNNQANCTNYGRLYDWSTAMSLPSNCNPNSCASQIQYPHQGICPDGWHIPSYDDWDVLMDYVGGSSVAGTKLRAASGWNNNGNGTDEYGFSALPGGLGDSDSNFNTVGNYGYWWSASEYNSDNAYIRHIYYNNDYAYWNDNDKSYLFSVRCLQDEKVSGGKGNNISNYETVVIGTQTWMAENLDYAVEGSKCYRNVSAYCYKYGRLYDWSTAMGLPPSCNDNSCSSEIQSPHRGICPTGWHIPSYGDWNVLMDYVGGFSVAGTKLKTTSGWNNNGNGTDEYGFSALPSSRGNSDGSFNTVGYDGYWWSARESGSYYAYLRSMNYNDDGTYWDYTYYFKSNLFSVRCLKDDDEKSSSSSGETSSSSSSNSLVPSSSSSETSSSSSSSSLAPSSSSSETSSSSSSSSLAPSSSSFAHSGKGNNISNYRTVEIGTQTWMAENLDYVVEGSKCYDNDPANCDIYGSLYDWATAMALPLSCDSNSCSSQIQSKHRGICPYDWHIPNDDDWNILMNYVGGSLVAGKHLKATSGWAPYSGIENLDTYGFSALPGGLGFFFDVGDFGLWWSASEDISDYAYSWVMYYNYDYTYRGGGTKSNFFSVRCLQD